MVAAEEKAEMGMGQLRAANPKFIRCINPRNRISALKPSSKINICATF